MDRFLSNLGESWNKLLEEMSGWLDAVVLQLPNLVLALIVMLLAVSLVRKIQRWSTELIGRFVHNFTVKNLMSNVVSVLFMSVMIFIVLDILNLEKALTSLLAGAGVAGLAVGLALQEPLVNLFSGILMSVRSLYNVGDFVTTNDYDGTIRDINLRFTTILTVTGESVVIPNKLVIQNPLRNYSTTPGRIIEVQCGVSYGEDLELVEKLVKDTLSSLCDLNPKSINFFYTGFGGSSIDFTVRYPLPSCTNQQDFLHGRSKAIKAIKEAFDENDITIPFPIRTLDFGIKGGEKLSEMIENKTPSAAKSQ